MYGFIFITTNRVNGKKYLGKRKYSTGWKSFLGDSILLLRDIDKYGKYNFTREIIAESKNEEDLNKLEVKLLEENNCFSNDWYNLRSEHSNINPFAGYEELGLEQWQDRVQSTLARHEEKNNRLFYVIDLLESEIVDEFSNRSQYLQKYGVVPIINGSSDNIELTNNHLIILAESFSRESIEEALNKLNLYVLVNVESKEVKRYLNLTDIDEINYSSVLRSLKDIRVIDGYFVSHYKEYKKGLDKLIKKYLKNEEEFRLRNGIKLICNDSGEKFIFADCSEAAKKLGVSRKMVYSRLSGQVKSLLKGKYKVEKL